MLRPKCGRQGGRRNGRGTDRKEGTKNERIMWMNVEQPPKHKQSGQPWNFKMLPGKSALARLLRHYPLGVDLSHPKRQSRPKERWVKRVWERESKVLCSCFLFLIPNKGTSTQIPFLKSQLNSNWPTFEVFCVIRGSQRIPKDDDTKDTKGGSFLFAESEFSNNDEGRSLVNFIFGGGFHQPNRISFWGFACYWKEFFFCFVWHKDK